MRFILLRGLGRDQLHWRPLLRLMRIKWPNALIETPDISGTGVLFDSNSPLNLKDYISALNNQLSNSTEPAIIVGLSLGGMLALTWAGLMPEQFRHLVLINSSSPLTATFKRLQIAKAYRYPGAIFRFSKRMKEKAIYQLTCNSRPVDERVIDEWTEIQRHHPVKMVNQLRQIYAAFNFELPSKSILPPVSVFYSKADELVSPQCSRDLVAHYQANRFIHEWAGHDLPQDDPVWVVQQLEEILAGSHFDNN